MSLAAVVALLLPDWTGSGVLRPIWLFNVPVLLGIVGAAFVLKNGHPWWVVAATLLGLPPDSSSHHRHHLDQRTLTTARSADYGTLDTSVSK